MSRDTHMSQLRAGGNFKCAFLSFQTMRLTSPVDLAHVFYLSRVSRDLVPIVPRNDTSYLFLLSPKYLSVSIVTS